MPFYMVRNDLANMQVDAVVNAANPALRAGGGVCGSLFHAAGCEDMTRACEEIGRCAVGEVAVTPGFGLLARFVFHAVGPVWQGGQAGEAALLRQCYDRALVLAASYELESIAFPLISTGAFGFPKSTALAIALESFASFLAAHDLTIYLVVFDRDSVRISETLFDSVQQFIDDAYEQAYDYGGTTLLAASSAETESGEFGFRARRSVARALPADHAPAPRADELARLVENLDESFSMCLLRLIDERGMTDAEVYKRANISRKLFSKIRGNRDYHPSKRTVLAFAVALRLSLDETKSLLGRAGFALSRADRFDVVVEYFISRQLYDIFVINETLFAFDLMLLGS